MPVRAALRPARHHSASPGVNRGRFRGRCGASVCVGVVCARVHLRQRQSADAAGNRGSANQRSDPGGERRNNRHRPRQAARCCRPSASPPRAPSRERASQARGPGCVRAEAVALRDRRAQRCRRNAGGAAIGKPDDDLGRGPQFPSGGNEHGNPRSGARPRRRPALRLRQGQPILSARLQSRPRHRPGDILGRHTDQFADQCPRPGLRRPELSHSRNDQRIGSPQGTLFRRRRRFRQCRRPASFPARQRPTEHRLRDSRQLRLRPVPDTGLDRARRRIAALCRRIQDLRWSLGHRRRRPQVQRSSALQPRHGDERVFRNRDGVHQQLELIRSGRAARHYHRTDRPVRRDRPDGRRRHQPVHAVDQVCAIR